MAPPCYSHPSEIATTQLFSRRGVGFLWNRRNELDPGQVSIINSLYNNRKKGSIECQQTIVYKLSRSKAGQLGYGRYVGTKGSLETLQRECRGTICRDYYHDIDIVNCHPVLVVQFARTRYGKDLPQLDIYCRNRDKVLAAINPNREDAKTEINRIMYGGSNRHDITLALSNEMRAFSKFLSQQPEFADLFAAVKHEDNVYGTFFSLIMQTEERRCMIAMKTSLEAAGWSVDVQAYDGVMVRKREGVDLGAAMRAAEVAIATETGYEVQLINKEFSYFEVPTVDEEISKGVSRADYDEMKAQFEQNHFYHVPTNQVVEVRPNGEMIFMKPDHAASYLGTEFVFRHSDKFGDYTSFLPLWLKQGRRNVYTIDMKPSDDPTVYSPPFRPAYLRGQAPEDPQPYIDMFQRFLAALIPEDGLRAFVIEWMAQLIQNPFSNSMACVILSGGKGCGKDTLGDYIASHLIGREYSQNYTSTEQFWDKHDVGRLNKLFVKLEEANGLLNRRHDDVFKAIITSETLTVNPKGSGFITTGNYNRFFLTTNEVAPVKLDDEERRFVLIPCGSELTGEFEFWRSLRSMLFTPTGARAIGDWLAQQPVGSFPRILPRSQLAQDLIDEEKSVEQRFLEAEVWDGEDISAGNLYVLYRQFCVDQNLPYSKSAKSFGIRLLACMRSGNLRKRVLDGCAVYYLE
jgi:hypothetical protein